jgi:myo-inositol-1-phosphate synthase
MNDENKPLSYTDWLAKNGLSATDDYYQYSNYLKEWYNQKKLPTSNLRNEYVQLLKEINYVFGDEKRDRFLSQIDFNNREDLINSLPYFTTKIKELAKSFNEKRRALKDSKLKYNLTDIDLFVN